MSLFRALVVGLFIAGLSAASSLLAESAGRLAGQTIDAGGRPLAMLRVELLEARGGQPTGVPIQVNVTDGRGAWSFSSVPAGDYIVRAIHNSQVFGVPVSIADAAGVTDVLIVAPSLPVSNRSLPTGPAKAAAAGVWTTGTYIAAAAAVAAFATLVVLDDAS